MRRNLDDAAALALTERRARYLVEHPQRLGIAPTFSFWTRPDVITRAVLFAAPFGAAGGVVRYSAGGSPLDTVVFAILGALWGLGLVERGLRILVQRREAGSEKDDRAGSGLPPSR